MAFRSGRRPCRRAHYIRVNVLCGARVADQGLLQGIAHDLLRLRSELKAESIKIFADVDVKHSAPLAERNLIDEVDDTLHRGLADALIVSGAGTGKATDPEKVRLVKSAATSAPFSSAPASRPPPSETPPPRRRLYRRHLLQNRRHRQQRG